MDFIEDSNCVWGRTGAISGWAGEISEEASILTGFAFGMVVTPAYSHRCDRLFSPGGEIASPLILAGRRRQVNENCGPEFATAPSTPVGIAIADRLPRVAPAVRVDVMIGHHRRPSSSNDVLVHQPSLPRPSLRWPQEDQPGIWTGDLASVHGVVRRRTT